MTNTNDVIRRLDDDLILRRATPDDAEALVDFNSRVHSDDGWEQPDEQLAAWARDLLTRPHPTCQVGDFTLVQQTRSGAIVSSLNLIPQTWSYAGIEFGVGRPELVGTHPDYRRRGLVRAQFQVIHRWSAQRGHALQAIYGIPWYYRMFGYEMGLELDAFRMGYKMNIPKPPDGPEPYNVRPAGRSDLEFIAQTCDRGCQRSLVCCVRDREMWQYDLKGRSTRSIKAQSLCIIEAPGGKPIGFLSHAPFLYKDVLHVMAYELGPGVSWLAVTPSVLRYLQVAGEACAQQDEKNDFQAFIFQLGSQHPVYEVVPHRLPLVRKPYAWYVRVPDLPGFLQLISPVLEKRLAQSLLVGHSGELTLGFYRDGVRLLFDRGRLVEAQAWQPTDGNRGMACFPDLTFLQLLFGYRSLDELDYAFADCSANNEARPLLNALFPKWASNVWPVS